MDFKLCSWRPLSLLPDLTKQLPFCLYQILFDVKLQPACAESWALGGRCTFNSLNYLDFVKSVCVTAIFQGQEDVELRRGSDFLNCVLLARPVQSGIWEPL